MQKEIPTKVVVITILALTGVVLLSLTFALNMFYWYDQGQVTVIDKMSEKEIWMLNLSSDENLTKLRAQFFPERLNYTELLVWESQRLNFTENRVFHYDPLEIVDSTKGACGEFTILYVAACLANNISARILMPAQFIPNIIDHAWAEVNPSNDGKTWIQVDSSDSCVAVQKGTSVNDLMGITINNTMKYSGSNYKMVLAFQVTQDRQIIIIDRTDIYSPAG